jgi:hypothetical protein
LLLLPDIDFLRKDFFQKKEDKQYWTKEAKSFSARLVSALVALDTTFHAGAEVTPEPAWAGNPEFAMGKELSLQQKLLESEREVEEAQKRKEQVKENLRAAGVLRALLYEKGKRLETTIIAALELLDFRAAPYKDDASEFDVVFESSEGRLLGEAEGKDNKPINVDKLRQLSMNIHEDLLREEVEFPAKGVLFGNGFRLSPPTERGVQFTDKCISAALSASTALIATSDLYVSVQYLSEQADASYAKQCREAIITGVGVVKLPPPPTRIIDLDDNSAGVSQSEQNAAV